MKTIQQTMLSVAKFAKLDDDNSSNKDVASNNNSDMEYNEESSFSDSKRMKINDETYIEQEEDKDLKHNPYLDLAGNLDTVVIPREFQYGEQTIQKKGVKATFFCDVCYVELSSHETMKSHSNGAPHQKKMLALQKEKDDKVRRGEKNPDDPVPGIRPIPNPKPLKVKVPMRLAERVKGATEPVVGLAFITELLTESDPEMEPHYECELCGSVGTSNSMFSHLMGFKHRQAFAVEKLGQRYAGMSQKELLNFANDHSENKKQLSLLIRTTRSDSKYPWPAGKAPWAEAMGGSGIAPSESSSRSNGNAKSKSNLLHKAKGNSSSKSINSITLPRPEDLKPTSNKEAEEMMRIGRNLVEMALRSDHAHISFEEKEILLSSLNSVLGKANINIKEK